MERSDFGDAAPGRLVRNLSGQLSFVPAPLPGRFAWTDRLVRNVTAAGQSLGQLAGLGRRMPNPQRLLRMFLRREAEFSSRIEQTFAGVRALLLFEHLPGAGADDAPAVIEVANNYRVLEAACGQAVHGPLSATTIRRMHGMLFEGLGDKGGGRAGEYRAVPNFIGNSPRIEDARYVPPPPGDVPACMDGLVRFVNTPGDLPTVVRCAMAHYQFEAIHPFFDGNGRIGRVLVLSMLSREGVLPVPLINPSAELERRRREYYDGLLDVTRRGEWATWIEFFAGCVEREADDACRRLIRLDALRDAYRGQFAAARTSALLLRLVDELFADPAVTVRDASNRLGINSTNAQRLVDKLVAGGMLQEVTGQQRNRVYMAQAIVDVFASPTGKRTASAVPQSEGE